MSSEVSFDNVFDILKKNFLWIVIIGVIGAAVGAGYSYTIDNRFKSTAVVYPVNIFPLSDESETEQMMQLFQFVEIRNAVIDKFKLYERDELVPGAPEYRHWVNLLYDERVSISATRFESVEITCQDEDPEVAKQMVEEIIAQFNAKNRQINSQLHQEYFEMKEGEMARFLGIIDSLKTRQSALREGSIILDIEGQSESLTKSYLDLLARGSNQARLRELKDLMRDVGEKGGEISLISTMIEGLGEYYSVLMEDYNKEAAKINDQLSYAQVIVTPEEADKKSYPVRWIIVVISFIASIFLSMIFFAIRERLA